MFQPVLDAVLTPAHVALTLTAEALSPGLGSFAVPVALVLFTLAVRASLVPLAVMAARAQRAKRALYPLLKPLRRRHADDPARLAAETRRVYRDAGVSPFAGLLPVVLQGPLLFLVYKLCVLPTVAGTPNVVVAGSVAGASLAERALTVVTAVGVTQPPGIAVVVLVALLIVVAAVASAQAVRLLRATAPEQPTRTELTIARWAPFATVVAVAVVPLAVTVYLLASTTWSVAERAALARLVG